MTRRILFAAFLLAVLGTVAAVSQWRPMHTLGVAAPAWQPARPHLRGAYHVHSTVSDGSGTPDAIARAAVASGLDFVILTDHGDGTRAVQPPRYVDGVLCIDAVEINTSDGHVVALGMRPSSYPLAGPAVAVVEDIHRLGGMAIAAHPDSPRESLRWLDWSVPVDGVEWLNADSEWRDEFAIALGRMLVTYRLGPAQTLAALLDRPVQTLGRWDGQLLSPADLLVGHLPYVSIFLASLNALVEFHHTQHERCSRSRDLLSLGEIVDDVNETPRKRSSTTELLINEFDDVLDLRQPLSWFCELLHMTSNHLRLGLQLIPDGVSITA